MQNNPIFIDKINRFQKKENLVFYLTQTLIIVSVALLTLFSVTILETLFNFNKIIRTSFIIFLFITFLFLLIKLIFHPLFKQRFLSIFDKYIISAKKIGYSFPQIKDKLINAIDLYFNLDEKYYSKDLTLAYINNIDSLTEKIDFLSLIKLDKLKRISFIFIFGLVSFFSFLFLNDSFASALYRIINYNIDFIKPAKFSFIVEPGDTKITKGENLKVIVKAVGDYPNKITLNYANFESDIFESKELKIDSNFTFKYEFVNPNKSFKYFVSAEDINSNIFNVEVINRPIVKNLKIKITPPAYSKLNIQELEDNGDIFTIFGSKIEMEITSSNPLKSASIFFSDSTLLNFDVKNFKGNLTFSAKKNTKYYINLLDKDDNTNINPVQYSIEIFNDNYPEINILKPEDNLSLTESNLVPTLVKVKDDYGISKVTLNYRLSYSKYELPQNEYSVIKLNPINETEGLINYLWDVSNLNLVTEDVVSYYFEVFDNDNVSGPKSTKSNIQTLRLPSLNEIIAESETKQKENITDLENVLKEAEELKKDIESLEKDLKSGKEKLTWNEQKKAEELIKKQKSLLDKIDNIQNQFEQIKNSLSENKLISKETLEKYLELQKLFEELSSDELKAAMEKLNETMKNLSKQAMQEALKNFKINEEALRENIERTLNLLKRVQIEQKMDELIKQTDNLIKQQEQISEKLKNTNPQDKSTLEQLSKQQKELSKQIENLQNKLAELQNKMKEFEKEMPLKELEQLNNELSKEELEKESDNAAQEMMSGDLQEASSSQSKIKQNLSKTKASLSKMKSQMMQNQMRMAMNMMKQILNNLLDLSKEQEELKRKTQDLNINSPKLSETKKEQFELLEKLNDILKQLGELSKKSFSVTPDMARSLGNAFSQMNQSLQNLENSNNYGSVQNQTLSMGSLNEAATQMNSMLQEMMQGGQGGGSMMSFMQRLQQLSAQQLALNQLTQQLLSGGQLTMEQQAQLQRLAAQQQAIQKSLEELNNEIRQSNKASKMIGDLNDAIKKMEEVVNELRQNKSNPETIKKQEKILTRLLDAQKSLNERDYEKKRESRPGDQNLSRKTPQEIINDNKKSKIQIDLLKTMMEGYSKDYEILIRKYFEELQKLEQ